MSKPLNYLDTEFLEVLLDWQVSRQCDRDNTHERSVLRAAIATLRIARIEGRTHDPLGKDYQALKGDIIPHLKPVVDATLADIKRKLTNR